MSNIETISSILATAEKRKDRRLGKQLSKPNPLRMRVYCDKLYNLFLRLIDEESRENLTNLDKTINSINEKHMVNGGWHLTERAAFSENSERKLAKDANGNEIVINTFEMPRTEEGYVLQDYVPDTTDLIVIRNTEARFLQENAGELTMIHEAFKAKREILDNGEYTVADEKNQELLSAIERLFGYNKVKEATMQK